MPDAFAGQIYEVSAVGSWVGQRILFSQTYILDTIDAGVDSGLASETLMKYIRGGVGGLDLYEALYLDCLPAQYQLVKWRTQITYPVRLVGYEFNRGVNGANVEDTETGNQAAALTFRTAFAGRNQVATKHIGPLPQGPLTQDDGMLTVAYKALVAALGAAMLNAIADLPTNAVWTPVIDHGPIPAPPPTPIESYVVGETIRTQRRRTLRLGE